MLYISSMLECIGSAFAFLLPSFTPPLLEVSEAYAVRTAFRKRFKRDLVIVANVTQSR